MTYGDLPCQLKHLETLASAREMERYLEPILAELGLDIWIFGLLDSNSFTCPRAHMVSNFPLAWGLEYRLRGYGRIDYVLQGLSRQLLPLVWNPADPRGKTENDLRFDTILRTRKWGGGVAFYVRAEGGRRLIFNAAFRRPFPEIEPIIKGLLPVGQFIATYVMEGLIRVTAGLPVEAGVLTTREEEVLRLYVDGKTLWEIGVILGISERTARAHLDRAAEKFGFSNKREAVTKAIAAGMLAPNLDDMTAPLTAWESSRYNDENV